MAAAPAMISADGMLCGALRIKIERKHVRRVIGQPSGVESAGLGCGRRLIPYRLSIRQAHRARIIEAAHAAHAAEVVIERPVLLHQDHYMLHILNGASSAIGGNGKRFGYALWQHRHSGRGTGQS